MKNFFTLVLLLAGCLNAICQAPQKMSYQAVVRNSSNNLVSNSVIGMKISLLQGSVNGTAVYVETQTATSNANGLVSIEIGTGVASSGTFASINWANGPYFIKTETDPLGGTNYNITGTSQLLSVPYALYAEKVNPATITKRHFYNTWCGLVTGWGAQTWAVKTGLGYQLPQNVSYKEWSYLVPFSGQIKNLMVTPETAAVPVGFSADVKVYLNGVPTNLAINFTNADGFNLKTNSTTVLNVNAGDFIAIVYSTPATGIGPATLRFQTFLELSQ